MINKVAKTTPNAQYTDQTHLKRSNKQVKRAPTLIKTKLKQQNIAETLGISQPTVSNWLKMKAKPTGLAKVALENHFPELAEAIELAWKN